MTVKDRIMALWGYTAIIGVPILLILLSVSYVLNIHLASLLLTMLISAGLVVYSLAGVREIFAHKNVEGSLGIHDVVQGVAHRRHAHVAGAGTHITLRVKRFDRLNQRFAEDTYSVSVGKHSTVLDALMTVKETQDPTLSMRYSCRMGICGSCGMNVNGKPSLACETNVLKQVKDGELTVSPMLAHPLLKDLVTDFDDFFEKHMSVKPVLYRDNRKEQYAARKEYPQTQEQINKYLPFSYCIMCGLCLDACPVVNTNSEFVGPQALSQVARYHNDSRDQMNEKRLNMIDSIIGAWGCEYAGACSEVCPKGVDPALAIQLLKSDILKATFEGEEE